MGKKFEVLGEKWNKTLKPITEAQKEYHRKHSARYIFQFSKNGDAFCQNCESNFMLNRKTTHLEKTTCPVCKAKATIHHTWRTTNYPTVRKFMVIPKVMDKHTLLLRFIEANSRYDNPRMEIKECARMYIDEYRSQPEYWCKTSNIWKKAKAPYFVSTYAFYTPNPNFCGTAYEYPRNFFKEINKLDCFKYYPCEDVYDIETYSLQLHYLVRSAKLNEKLSKLNLGIESIERMHRSYYICHNDRTFQIDTKRNDLKGMLKLDQPRFNILMESTFSFELVSFLQKHPELKREDFILADFNTDKYMDYVTTSAELGVSYQKYARYVNKFIGMEGIPSQWEYKHYLYTLRDLGYDLKDLYYSMPKDFRKADKRITDEYHARQAERARIAEEKRLQEDARKNELISKISKGLMELPEIKDLCGTSNGLLVYVPESAEDLYEEGKAQHNCVGTYVGRVATQQTLVFFIRQLKNPSASFITMEMSYSGEVRQIMYEHNKPCKDENIINFVDKLSEIVKRNEEKLRKLTAA